MWSKLSYTADLFRTGRAAPFLAILLSLLLCLSAFAQPPGETCENALLLSVPDTVSGTTVGLTNDYNYLCDGGTETGNDIVYTFTPAANDTVTFNLCTGGTDFNTRLYIYAGSCASNQIIACDRFGCEIYYNLGWRSVLRCVPLSAGNTYYVVIDGGTATQQGNYVLITNSCPPPGETCSSAIPISIPDTATGNTCTYSDQYDAICPFTWNVYSYDVVYSFIPAFNLRADFSLCTGTTNYDTKMFIFRDICQSYSPIACNDDACEAPHFEYPFVSRINDVSLLAGSTYYIVVDAYNQVFCGDYTLVTSLVPPDPPQHLTIRREPGDTPYIRLRWNSSFGANLYHVYRDAVDPLQTLLASTADTTYVDSSAIGYPAAHYFYSVTAGVE